MEEQQAISQPASRIKDYNSVCWRLGFFMTIILLLREAATVLLSVVLILLNNMAESATGVADSLQLYFGAEGLYALQLGFSAVFLQIIPSVIAVFLLKYGKEQIKAGYKIPKNNAKALTNFPACYGLGMTVNLITLVVTSLITKTADYNEAFNPITSVAPPSFASAVILFVFVAVIAPVFEEFIFRGAVLNALKPYGKGVAIFTSAFMFGIMHGNFSQVFYATAIGIVLGYIATVTGSIFTTTVMHALFNSISGVMMLFISTSSVQKYYGVSEGVPDGDAFVITMYAIFQLAVVLTALIGFGLMIKKLIKIKRYFLPQVWSELTTWGKVRRLLFTPGMIIGIVLTADVFAGCWAITYFDVINGILTLLGIQ